MPKKAKGKKGKAPKRGSSAALKLVTAYEKGYKDAIKDAEKVKRQLTSKFKKVIAKKRSSAKKKTVKSSKTGRRKSAKRKTSSLRKLSLRRKTSMRRHRRAA